MKNVLKFLLCIMLGYAVVYFGLAFVMWEFDASQWEKMDRVFFFVLSAPVSMMFVMAWAMIE